MEGMEEGAGKAGGFVLWVGARRHVAAGEKTGSLLIVSTPGQQYASAGKWSRE